jgi:hypothetical protein
VNHTAADGFSNGGSKEESSEKVESGGPCDCETRRQDARGDNRGDRVRGIMESVYKIKNQRDQDCDENKQNVGMHRERGLQIFQGLVTET